jgi:hypothetical protein
LTSINIVSRPVKASNGTWGKGRAINRIRPSQIHHCKSFSILVEVKDNGIYSHHAWLIFYSLISLWPGYQSRQLIWSSDMNKLEHTMFCTAKYLRGPVHSPVFFIVVDSLQKIVSNYGHLACLSTILSNVVLLQEHLLVGITNFGTCISFLNPVSRRALIAGSRH